MAYSFNWAYGVLNAFCYRYPRASRIVVQWGGIKTRQVARALIVASPAWEEFKKVVKMIDHGTNHWDSLSLPALEPQELGALDHLRVSLLEFEHYNALDTEQLMLEID